MPRSRRTRAMLLHKDALFALLPPLPLILLLLPLLGPLPACASILQTSKGVFQVLSPPPRQPATTSPRTPGSRARHIGRNSSVKPCRLAQLVACRTATAPLPRYKPKKPPCAHTRRAAAGTEPCPPAARSVVQATTSSEQGPMTSACAAPPPAPAKHATATGGRFKALIGPTARSFKRVSLAAIRTAPDKAPSTNRALQPDHKEGKPRSRT